MKKKGKKYINFVKQEYINKKALIYLLKSVR